MNKSILFLLAWSGVFCVTNIFAQTPTWSWKTLSDPPEARFRFNDIFFINPAIGWAILPHDNWNDTATFGRIYKTTDGGNSWTIQLDSSRNHFRCVGFVDSLHGWVFSLGGDEYYDSLGYDTTLLFETTDGGASWFAPTNTIEGPLPRGLCGMSVVNKDVVYVCGRYGGPSYVMKTTDAGKMWKSIDMNSYAADLIDCYFWSPDSGIVVGSVQSVDSFHVALILFTSDGGTTWIEKHRTGPTPELCWKISFPSPDIGYVSLQTQAHLSSRAAVLKTTDGGNTWQRKRLPNPSSFLQGIGFINDSVGWTGGWNGEGWQTTDGGGKWSQPFIGLNLNRFRFFGDSVGYCAGKSIFKLTKIGESAVAGATDVFVSSLNYPNPFETATNISFSLSEAQHVTLKIYDVLGTYIQTLFDEVMPAGGHLIPFTPDQGMDNGIYFYRLRLGASEIQHTMLLLR